MIVKLKQGMAGPKMNVRAGAVVELPDALGKELVESGQAERVDIMAPVNTSISDLLRADAPPVEVEATAPAVPPVEVPEVLSFDRSKLEDAKEGE